MDFLCRTCCLHFARANDHSCPSAFCAHTPETPNTPCKHKHKKHVLNKFQVSKTKLSSETRKIASSVEHLKMADVGRGTYPHRLVFSFKGRPHQTGQTGFARKLLFASKDVPLIFNGLLATISVEAKCNFRIKRNVEREVSCI